MQYDDKVVVLRFIGGKEITYYDGLTDVDLFFNEFEHEVPEDHRFQALELALHATLAQWWGTHKDRFARWRDYRRMMKLQFGHVNTRMTETYNGRANLCDHLVKWTKAYGTESHLEWVHIFFHNLDTIPVNWNLEMKLHHGIAEWDILKEGLLLTFIFEDNFESIDEVLQH